MVHVNPNVVISLWENGSIPHKTPITQPLFFIFVAMIFFSNKNSTPLKIFQVGADG
jgi:hypothetical protein